MYHLQKSILYNTLTIENNKAHNLLPKYLEMYLVMICTMCCLLWSVIRNYF